MKVTPQVVLEYESRLAFRNFLPKTWIVRDKIPDYGIDMEVEIVEEGQVTEKIFWVQLKATESMGSPSEGISYPMETKHLKHFEICRLPVVIVLWVKSAKIFCCLFAQKHIQEGMSMKKPDWRNQKTYTIEFPSHSRIESADVLKSIATEGYFYILQHQLSLKLGAKSAVYWLDGIPKSDNEELKKRTLKALAYMQDEKYEDAKAEFEETLRVCTISPTERMAILLNIGMAYWMLGESKIALKNYEAVLELVSRVGENDALLGKAHASGDIGIIYSSRGDLGKALKYHRDALRIFRKLGYKNGEASQLGNIGIIYLSKGDSARALRFVKDALKIHKKIGYKVDEVTDLTNIGRIYSAMGDLDTALKCHKDALKISQETRYKEGEANQLCNIGVVYLNKGDLVHAFRYMKNALKIHKEIGFLRGVAADLTNIGLIYKAKGDTANALRYIKNALKIHKKIGYKEGEANQLGNIGLIYLDKRDCNNAFKYLTVALNLLDKHHIAHGRDIIQRAINSITQDNYL